MSIKIATAVFCRNPDCPAADGTLYHSDWAAKWRCPFCGTMVSRVKDHIRLPRAPLRIVRPTVPTTYRADGSFVDLGVLDEMEVTA